MDDKKFGLYAGIGMVVCIFLPLVSVMGASMGSLFDIVKLDIATEATLIVAACIGSAVFAYKDNAQYARICSGVVLAGVMYWISQLPGGFGSFFDFAGIGLYALIASSAAGVYFNK